MKLKLTILLLCLLTSVAYGSRPKKEQNNAEAYQLQINLVDSQIKLDGILDEESWQNAQESSSFINKWPQDTGYAAAQTKVKLLYDQDFLYVSAICLQDQKDVVIQSLKRDNLDGFWNSDGFSIVIDPINQKTNGFLFGVNAGGAQVEATLTARGSQTNMDANWDNKWYSAVQQYEDRWVVEMAIPFKTLRYNDSKNQWGINLIRNDMKRNVYSTWARVPLAFRGIDLGYLGTLQWDNSPKKTKGNIALIPYTSAGVSKDYEENEPADKNMDVGLDAKIALTSSLNLDLTINPDFSNVDVDQQVTNVTRFSIFFPERRAFFLENSDLFTDFGSWGVRPFFSRRIGIDGGDPVPIAFGARISGNLTDDIRIGLMDVHTKATSDLNPTNFFVGSVQKRILDRSSVKVLFTNKEDFPDSEGGDVTKSYNRTGGAEFNYTSKDGSLNGSLKGHWSTTEESLDENAFMSATINGRGENLYWGLQYNQVGENYIAEMGFVPRLSHYDPVNDTTIRIGYQTINPWIGYNWYGNDNTNYREQELWTWTVVNYSTEGDFMERRTNVGYSRQFLNNSRMRVTSMIRSVQLMVPAEFIDDEHDPLPIGRYNFTFFSTRYSTNQLKKVSAQTELNYGGFFNGNRLEFSEEISIRAQPWGVFAIAYRMNRLELPGEYGSTTLHLIGPRAEISLRNNLWWTTFLQYNTQAENFNINSRLQWRYKPMSDLFIVYSDNYATTGSEGSNFQVKNRGLVFKLTYWFNI